MKNITETVAVVIAESVYTQTWQADNGLPEWNSLPEWMKKEVINDCTPAAEKVVELLDALDW